MLQFSIHNRPDLFFDTSVVSSICGEDRALIATISTHDNSQTLHAVRVTTVTHYMRYRVPLGWEGQLPGARRGGAPRRNKNQ